MKHAILILLNTISLNRTKMLVYQTVNEQDLMKWQPRTHVTHYQNSNFKHKMKRLEIPENFTYTKLLP